MSEPVAVAKPWAHLVDKGFEAPIFEQFDAWGEERVRLKLPGYNGGKWEEHGLEWLKVQNDLRERRAEERIERELGILERTAAAGEQSASAAATSAREAAKARKIAGFALIAAAVAASAAIVQAASAWGSNENAAPKSLPKAPSDAPAETAK
ncbi:MAG: hypothetical protein ACOY5Y_07230 [Pseudomonadota bacterium]